jgi:signal peptidase II
MTLAEATSARRGRMRLGLVVAVIACVVDQAFKLWMLFQVGMVEGDRIAFLPMLDLVMVWNYGVSYGLFQQESAAGQWALVAFKVVAVAALLWWLARIETRIGAIGLGLIIGGAIGNGIDRAAYGAVADFFYFHVGSFDWYVFNLADVAIVAGVAFLLYEAFLGKGPPAHGMHDATDGTRGVDRHG